MARHHNTTFCGPGRAWLTSKGFGNKFCSYSHQPSKEKQTTLFIIKIPLNIKLFLLYGVWKVHSFISKSQIERLKHSIKQV